MLRRICGLESLSFVVVFEAVVLATGCRSWRRVWRNLTVILGGIIVLALSSSNSKAGGPQVAPAYQNNFTIQKAGTVPGQPAQLVFGPSGLLYIATVNNGVISFVYNAANGTISTPVNASPNVVGIGVAFSGGYMYQTAMDGSLHKLNDTNGNGVWGEAGEMNLSIVTGIPQGDHNIDQLQIAGNTLYVGIGRRTINGHRLTWTGGSIDDFGGKGFWSGGTGETLGDSAYNGTICWIQDLTQVVNQTGSATAFNTEPPTFSRQLIVNDSGPFTNVGAGKLLVHSAGTRNPFGLCLDSNGNLWFTNNFNRVMTTGDGNAGFGLKGDALDSDFSRDVQDQLFQASPGADYGYTDSNWRGVNPMLTPGSPGYHRVNSTTFDNLYNKGPYTLHDPANPDGLGPSSSPDGCSFSYSTLLPAELQGNIFIARYTGTNTEAPGGAGASLTFSDVVAVNVSTGKVVRVASGFTNPVTVLADDQSGRLLIADYGDQIVYALQYVGSVCGPGCSPRATAGSK